MELLVDVQVIQESASGAPHDLCSLHPLPEVGAARARWMLEEVGASYQVVQPAAGPGPMPKLVDNGVEIAGDMAILIHLADAFPAKKLAPPVGTAERARYQSLMRSMSAMADPMLEAAPTVAGPKAGRKPVQDDETTRRVEGVAQMLDEALGKRPFLLGDTFSAADVVAGSLVVALRPFRVLGSHPSLVDYFRRIQARPAFQSAYRSLALRLYPPEPWPTSVMVRAGSSGPPLFLLARPNMRAEAFAVLVKYLDTARPIYVLQRQYPEESALGRPYTREEIVAGAVTYFDGMRAVQPEGPYFVAGMCEGGQYGYELARLAEAQGVTLGLVGMIDTWPEENTRVYWLMWVSSIQASLQQRFSKAKRVLRGLVDPRRRPPPPPPPPPARQVPPGAPGPNKNLWHERVFPKTPFVPQKVHTRITVFRATKQPYWRIRDRALGWSSRTTGGVEVYEVKGYHTTLMHEPQARALGEQISACLRRLGGTS